MDVDKAVELIEDLLASSRGGGADDAAFVEWRTSCELVLSRALGPEHMLTCAFRSISYTIPRSNPALPNQNAVDRAKAIYFDRGVSEATGLLKAAIFELRILAEPATVASDATVDPELWAHVEGLVNGEEWPKVATNVAVFVEDRLREWAGLDNSKFGKDLMTAVFKPGGGIFPLGIGANEQDGWHLYALGLAAAVSNADRHRVQKRDDLKRYAMGVLGAASLLLTQLRYQHGNSFQA